MNRKSFSNLKLYLLYLRNVWKYNSAERRRFLTTVWRPRGFVLADRSETMARRWCLPSAKICPGTVLYDDFESISIGKLLVCPRPDAHARQRRFVPGLKRRRAALFRRRYVVGVLLMRPARRKPSCCISFL